MRLPVQLAAMAWLGFWLVLSGVVRCCPVLPGVVRCVAEFCSLV